MMHRPKEGVRLNLHSSTEEATATGRLELDAGGCTPIIVCHKWQTLKISKVANAKHYRALSLSLPTSISHDRRTV